MEWIFIWTPQNFLSESLDSPTRRDQATTDLTHGTSVLIGGHDLRVSGVNMKIPRENWTIQESFGRGMGVRRTKNGAA